MKLGELKAQIRANKGAPEVYVSYGPEVKFLVAVQKQSLMEELDRIFGKERGAETGLALDHAGRLILETMRHAAPPLADEDGEDIDLDADEEELEELEELEEIDL